LEAFLVLEAFLEAGRLRLLEAAFLAADLAATRARLLLRLLLRTADLLRLLDFEAGTFLVFLGAFLEVERPLLAERLVDRLRERLLAPLAADFLGTERLLERLLEIALSKAA